ncbi:MAG: mechanosensitive ion channel [Kiritimatiellae bacterium]|nr:mechanosensitive ion channel [Kiritimatiellia bacterium]
MPEETVPETAPETMDLAAAAANTYDRFAAGEGMDVVIAATPYLVNLAIAIAILLIGKIVAFSIRKLIKKVMTARKIDGTIIGFVAGLVYAIIMVGVVLAALQRIGVQTTSFVAIIGAAGLAIGLALQGSLANFAAGFMLILFKPFKVGNFIEAGGTAGIVEEIDIFTTTLRTPDNRVIIVPNNAITSGAITNVNARDTRRIDLTIGVSYNDDLRAVKDLLLKILDEDERVLKDPAPTVGVLELGDSSVNFCVRPWVKASDFFPTMMDLNMTIKERIEAAGFSIPFPQQDVHLHTVEKS